MSQAFAHLSPKVWHYTTLSALQPILESGELRPGNHGGIYAVPLLWFSANQEWEPMAASLFQRPRASVPALRFGMGLDDPRLHNWRDTLHIAKRNRQQRRQAEAIAVKNGSSPTDWYTTLCAVPLDQLDYQTWWGGQWLPAECRAFSAFTP